MEISKKLAETAKKSRKYGYIFKTAAKLCEVLSIKYELGLKTRKAYERGDKTTLLSLAKIIPSFKYAVHNNDIFISPSIRNSFLSMKYYNQQPLIKMVLYYISLLTYLQ